MFWDWYNVQLNHETAFIHKFVYFPQKMPPNHKNKSLPKTNYKGIMNYNFCKKNSLILNELKSVLSSLKISLHSLK